MFLGRGGCGFLSLFFGGYKFGCTRISSGRFCPLLNKIDCASFCVAFTVIVLFLFLLVLISIIFRFFAIVFVCVMFCFGSVANMSMWSFFLISGSTDSNQSSSIVVAKSELNFELMDDGSIFLRKWWGRIISFFTRSWDSLCFRISSVFVKNVFGRNFFGICIVVRSVFFRVFGAVMSLFAITTDVNWFCFSVFLKCSWL